MLKKILFLALLIFCPLSHNILLGCYQTSCQTTCNDCQNDCKTSCACPCSGKTYFFNRPLFQSYRPELWASFRNDVMVAGIDSESWSGGAFDVVGYGSVSTNGCGLAQYFLPYCKQALVVKENVSTGNLADINARNFGIITTNGDFQSIISFTASHVEAGVGFHWKQGFNFNDDNTSWWYIDVDLPVTYVKNKFLISENIINDGGGISQGVAQLGIPVSPNMTLAMQQSSWNYGKVSNCCNLSRTGIADMELKFGYQFTYTNNCMLAGYVGVLIPTGNTPCGRYIFEPVVGHGKSIGFIWGTEGGYQVWENCNGNWDFWIDYGCQALYLFSHCQTRSFDLKNRPWSRYISVYLDQAQAAQANVDPSIGLYLSTPGINVFTKPVQVTPGFQTNITTSLVFQHMCGFNAEVGYNGFYRAKECLQFNWQTGPAIIAKNGAGSTNPYYDISGNPILGEIEVSFDNYGSSLIEKSDIDEQSATHPQIIVQLLYAQLGYKLDNREHPLHFGLGTSYEFALNDFAVMNRWALWGKIGFAF